MALGGLQHSESALIFNIILQLARRMLNLTQAQRGWLGYFLTVRALTKETTTLEVDNMQKIQMKKGQQGFTLIELMIVVAIIGILAAVAIPAYQDYTVRAQVSEGLSLASGAKTALAEYYNHRGSFPSDNASLGLEAANAITGSYVSQVDAGNTAGVIEVTYGNNVNNVISGAILSVSAVTSAGSIQWVCKDGGASTTLEDKYLPTNCR